MEDGFRDELSPELLGFSLQLWTGSPIQSLWTGSPIQSFTKGYTFVPSGRAPGLYYLCFICGS